MNRFFLSFFFLLILSQALRAQYYLEDRWPNIRFRLPVGMYVAPDTSKRIYVLEKTGRIKVFHDTGTVTVADTTTFLNLSSRLPNVAAPGDERGLLGLCFHPQYAQNGYFFVNYTAASPSLRTVVSRFTRDPNNPNRALANSEKVILTVNQPFTNHNAGAILFGDDGYLYITMGDGGSGGDPNNVAQNRTNLLGKILRVDINVPEQGPAYAIPPDNPFAGNPNGWREEIYCTGVRNPWKMTKDPNQSTIWMGDVGQGQAEEIDTLRKGANYGWKVMEGNGSYSACGNCDTSNYEKPLQVYGRSQGISVTGGYVYRGSEMPALKGAYIYGDYGSRRVWFLKKNANGQYQNNVLLLPAVVAADLSSFGLDHNNELYLIRYSSTNGALMKIRCAPARPILTAPAQTQVCAGDSLVLLAPVSAGVTGFLWSTGDTSRRLVLKETGVYNLSLRTRNALGCESDPSASLTVRILPRPVLPPIVAPRVCQGDTATLAFPPGLTYRWSGGATGQSQSFWQAGNHWVVGSDANTCRTDTGYFSVSILPLPATPQITQNGNNLVISAEAGSQVSWYLDGVLLQTSADTFLTPGNPGVYTAIVQNFSGCRSLPSAGFTVTSQSKIWQQTRFSVTPNPFQQEIRLSWEGRGHDQKADLEIVDAAGRLVFSEKVENLKKGQVHTIPSPDWKPGAYTIRLKTASGTEIFRILKK